MEYGFLMAGAVLCATLAIRARQLIATALWLAGTSALVAFAPVSYTHLRAHETPEHLVCRLLLEKKKQSPTPVHTKLTTRTHSGLPR